NLVPDGSNIGVTAIQYQSIEGGYYVPSACGTIENGTPSSSNGNWHYFPLVSNGFAATYSTDGSTNISPGQTGAATVQLVMVDPGSNVLDVNAISVQNIVLVPPSNAVGSSQPASVLGDGAVHTSTVVFTPIIDAYGNTVPDGTNLAVSAIQYQAISGGYYVP